MCGGRVNKPPTLLRPPAVPRAARTLDSSAPPYVSLTFTGRAALKRETRDWGRQTLAIERILKSSLGEF